MTKKRIALVEDDPDIADSVKFNLEKGGLYDVVHYASGETALDQVASGRFDLVLLDLSLPDVDGLTICRELRAFEPTRRLPILILTARVTERDRVRGLNVGADDYVTKPFSMSELVARVAAHLRRVELDRPEKPAAFDDGQLRVDHFNHQVAVNGKAIHLTKKELELLWLLIAQRPRPLSRETILARVWDYDSEIDTRTIDVHVRALRKKVGENYIETVVGVGYRFRERERKE